MSDPIEDHAIACRVLERIGELRRYEQWCRQQPNSAFWNPLRLEYRTELRSLLKVVRAARRTARAIADANDPMTLAAGDHFRYAR